MVSTSAEGRLGELLLREGLITREQLDAALARQMTVPGYVPLGRILVEQKAISERQLAFVLDRGDKRTRLGDLLVKSGDLTEARLEQALIQQQKLQRPLGEVLVKMGAVSDETMRQALGRQLDIPYVEMDRIEIDPRLTRLINSNYARRHVLVPVAQVGQMLTVCMDDPTKRHVVEELTTSTGFVVNVVTSSREAIRKSFQNLYGEPMDAPAPPPTAAASYSFVEALEASGADDVDLGETLNRTEFVSEYVQGKSADVAVRQLLSLALEHHCSDLHLETLAAGAQVRFRVDGILQELDLGPLKEFCDRGGAQIISRIKILGKLDIAERRRPQDGAFRAKIDRGGEPQYIDFRVSILPGYYGESCVLRILDKKNAPTSVDALGFSTALTDRLRQLLKRPAGMLLVAGPTGSGKSTTLYASLMAVYKPQIRVLTAEDPIEYVYDQFSQSEVNERIGNTFARYLRSFLRHDPEVIMIGEIRDEETAEMAFRAAQTGHLLLSTLHSNDAISTVTRLLDLKVDPNVLASSLLGVLAQRLVRRVCADCRQECEPDADLVREFFPVRPEGLRFYRGVGCRTCNFTGYKGRMCIAELWSPDERDVILISKQASFDQVRESALRTTISMAQDVMDRLVAGSTTLEELVRVMPYSSVNQFRRMAAAGLSPGAGARGQVNVAPRAESAAQVAAGGNGVVAAAPANEPTTAPVAAEPSPVQEVEVAAEPSPVEEVKTAVEPGPPPAQAAAAADQAPLRDRLFTAFREVGLAQSLNDVLTVLAGHAAAGSSRVAMLTVAESRLRLFAPGGASTAGAAAGDMAIVPNTVFGLAAARGEPVSTREAPPGHGIPWADALGLQAGRTGLAIPVLQNGQTVAILYAENASDQGTAPPDAWCKSLEVLVRHANWRLGVLARSGGPGQPPPAE